MTEQYTPPIDIEAIQAKIEHPGLHMLKQEYRVLKQAYGAAHAYDLLQPTTDPKRAGIRAAILGSRHAVAELYLADLFNEPNKPASGPENWQHYRDWESEWRKSWAWSTIAAATNSDPEKVAEYFTTTPANSIKEHFSAASTDYLELPTMIIACAAEIPHAPERVRHALGTVALNSEM